MSMIPLPISIPWKSSLAPSMMLSWFFRICSAKVGRYMPA